MKRFKNHFLILIILYGLVFSEFTVRATEFPIRTESKQQQLIVTGSVHDQNGESMVGVTIQIKGTGSGNITDIDGNFSISVPNERAVLVFSFIGYKTVEKTVGKQRKMNIVLEEDVTEMEEVVVVGYGVQQKVSITGAISAVDATELKVSSSPNIANALAGRISGLTSFQGAGGQPGKDDATMYLRGAATLNGTSPLILIDGVERSNIRTLDTHEIESISILKDASATAVFGVQGANGVLIITTKRGQKGRPQLSFNVTQTFSALTREPEHVSSLDYMALRNQALKNDGLKDGMFTAEQIAKYENPLAGLDPSDPDYERKAAIRRYMYPNNDYYRMMINRWSPQTVVNGNLSGGTDKISYFVNVGYTHQGGNLNTESKSKLGYDPSVKLDRYNFRSNVDYTITPKLKVYLNLATYIEKLNMPATGTMYDNDQNWMMRDMFYMSQTVPSIAPGPATIAGFGVEAGMPLDPSYLDSGHILDRSPYEIINHRGYLNETRANLNSTIGADWDLDFITKGLKLSGKLSYDSWSKTEVRGNVESLLYQAFINMETDELIFSEYRQNSSPLSLSKYAQSRFNINAEASLNYNRKFGVHEVSGLALVQRKNWEGTGADLPFNLLGVVGRVTYNYGQRYFGEVNVGYNGTEQFAPSTRFGFFPAFSLGWVPTNEEFLKDNPILTYMKLRGSFGKVGNDKMGNRRFLYIDNITLGGGGYHGSLAAGKQISEGLLGNTSLAWEVAEKMNIGLDFHIINDFKASIDFFKENRSDILLTRKSVPSFQGMPNDYIPKVNMGEVDNKGFEIELSYNKQINKDLNINLRGNFGYNKNKRMNVDEVPRDETYAYRTRETGFPIGQSWGYLIDWDQDGGYWNETSIANSKLKYDFGNYGPGDFVYKDLNDDDIIDDKDQAPIGCGNVPRIQWGGSVAAQYKGFDVYVFFQGLGKWYSARADHGIYETTGKGTYFPYQRNAWTQERFENGDKITYPRLSTGKTVNHLPNSFFIMNRSFGRLKNVEIGYTLPKHLLKIIGVSQLRLFVSGQNIFTWSPNYRASHLDPENNDTIGYPVTKMFNFGANITF